MLAFALFSFSNIPRVFINDLFYPTALHPAQTIIQRPVDTPSMFLSI